MQLYSPPFCPPVHGSPEAAPDASEASAWLYLPAPRPAAQSPPVHLPAGAVPRPALDPQVNRGCYHFPSHGRDFLHWTSPWGHTNVMWYLLCVVPVFFQLWLTHLDWLSCNLRFLWLWLSTLRVRLRWVQILALVRAGWWNSLSCR